MMSDSCEKVCGGFAQAATAMPIAMAATAAATVVRPGFTCMVLPGCPEDALAEEADSKLRAPFNPLKSRGYFPGPTSHPQAPVEQRLRVGEVR
jgi:hypothetical protein